MLRIEKSELVVDELFAWLATEEPNRDGDQRLLTGAPVSSTWRTLRGGSCYDEARYWTSRNGKMSWGAATAQSPS